MNRINKILIIFIIFIIATVFASWRALQSPMFAQAFTNYLNEKFITKIDANIEIGKVSFTVFPPATHFYDVSAHKEGLFDSRFKSLSLVFSPWDVFRSDIKISQVIINNGYANIDIKNSSKKESIENPFLNIQKSLKNLPFDFGEVELVDIHLQATDKLLNVTNLRVRPYSKSIDVKLELANFNYEDYGVDKLVASVELTEKRLRLKGIDVYKNSTKLTTFGEFVFGQPYKYTLQTELTGDIREIIPDNVQADFGLAGVCDCLIDVTSSGGEPVVGVRGELSRIRSIYSLAESLSFVAKYEDGLVTISKGRALQNGGEVVLRSPVTFSIKDFTGMKLDISAKNVHSHDFLYYLGKDFHLLEARVNGDVLLDIQKDKIKIGSMSDLYTDSLVLNTGTKLLDLKQVKVNQLKFTIAKKMLFLIDAMVGQSLLSSEGAITEEGINISTDVSSFELSRLNGLLGESLKGKGDFKVNVKGSFADTRLKVIGDKVKDLAILDYHLFEKTDADIEYHFRTNQLLVLNMNSYGSGLANGRGNVDFKKNSLAIDIQARKSEFAGLSKTLRPVWKEINPYLKYVDGEFAGDFSITGSFDDIKVGGNVFSKLISINNESFDSLFGKFAVDSKEIQISNVKLKKESSLVEFGVNYNFKKGIQSSALNVYEFSLSNSDHYRQLNLGYDGVVNARISMKRANGLVLNGQVSMLRSFVGKKQIKPSNLIFNYEEDRLSLAAVLLGGKGSLNAEVFLNKKSNKRSTITANANVEDLRTVFGILSLHNVYESDLRGSLVGSLRTDFKVSNPESVNVRGTLNKFNLKKLNKEIYLIRPGIIEIDNSEIKNIDVVGGGNGGSYRLAGQGNLFKNAKIEQSFRLSMNYAHLLSPLFERLDGYISGKGLLSGNIDKFHHFHEFDGKDIFVKVRNIPISVSNGNFSSIVENLNWTVDKLEADLGEGKVRGALQVKGVIPYPKVDGKLNFSDVNYPFGNSSNVNVSGNVKLLGEKLPYELSGSLLVNNGRILDEFTDLGGGSTYLKSVDKYIGVEKRGITDFLTLNIRGRIKDNIRVKNRLTDLFVMGNVDIVGNPLAPSFEGRLSTIPTLSKFKFKGNEFYIKEGLIDLSSKANATPIVLNFSSEARVSQYDVKMEVAGSVEDLKVNLESNPPLNKDDIFSLLALGVTRSYSENLEEKGRESLTTIGLGTLLVDQLQINEGLDSTLGLKLSLLPEVSESSETPIQSSGTEQISKVRTSTKVRVQKKVTDNIGVTYSNTFGGDGERVQEMNVDFNINEKISIQGVFENTENNNEEEKENSVGADIKWKWSF